MEHAIVIPKSENDVTKILKSEVNPLSDFRPPQHVATVENDTLLQAEEIRNTLTRIAETDPTAKRHGFRFIIAPENKELLEKNGCRVKIIGKGAHAYTEVSWEEVAENPIVAIPLPRGNSPVNPLLVGSANLEK